MNQVDNKMIEEIERQREKNENDIENSINNLLKNDIRSVISRVDNVKRVDEKIGQVLKNNYELSVNEQVTSKYDYEKINELNKKFKIEINGIKNDILINKKTSEQSLLVSEVCMKETDEFVTIVKKISKQFIELQNSIEKLQNDFEGIKYEVNKFKNIDDKLNKYVDSEEKLTKQLDQLIKLNTIREDNRVDEMKKMQSEFLLSQKKFKESKETFVELKDVILSNDELANQIENFKLDFYKFQEFKKTVDNQMNEIKNIQEILEFKKLVNENANAKMILQHQKKERVSNTFMTKEEKEKNELNVKDFIENMKQIKNNENEELLENTILVLKTNIFNHLNDNKSLIAKNEEKELENKIKELSLINKERSEILHKEYKDEKKQILDNTLRIDDVINKNNNKINNRDIIKIKNNKTNNNKNNDQIKIKRVGNKRAYLI